MILNHINNDMNDMNDDHNPKRMSIIDIRVNQFQHIKKHLKSLYLYLDNSNILFELFISIFRL